MYSPKRVQDECFAQLRNRYQAEVSTPETRGFMVSMHGIVSIRTGTIYTEDSPNANNPCRCSLSVTGSRLG